MNNLVLIGFKMSGKTTCGRMVARMSARRFIDIDDLMEVGHRRERGTARAPFEIYRDLGPDEYHRFEREAVASLDGVRDSVISTAGSTALHKANVVLLGQIGLRVMIDAPKSIIRERWFAQRLPAFVDAADPDASFERVYAVRAPLYRTAADIVVDTAGRTAEEVAHAIQAAERTCRGA